MQTRDFRNNDGIVRLNGGRCNRTVPAPYSTNAHLRFPLSSSSFSRRDHQSLRLALLPLHSELPRCRRNVSDAGCDLSYETVREWCFKFGQTYANGVRRKSPRPGDRWHLDEVFLKINGRVHYLWRAVDQDGDALDILVQRRRDRKAAKKFFRKLLKGLRYVPRVIITDKLKSYSPAKAEVMPGVDHLQQKYQNNRAEHSHQPTRLREKIMRRFKSAGHAQRFLSVFGIITSFFRVGRHLYKASGYRDVMKSRFAVWEEVTATQANR